MGFLGVFLAPCISASWFPQHGSVFLESPRCIQQMPVTLETMLKNKQEALKRVAMPTGRYLRFLCSLLINSATLLAVLAPLPAHPFLCRYAFDLSTQPVANCTLVKWMILILQLVGAPFLPQCFKATCFHSCKPICSSKLPRQSIASVHARRNSHSFIMHHNDGRPLYRRKQDFPTQAKEERGTIQGVRSSGCRAPEDDRTWTWTGAHTFW